MLELQPLKEFHPFALDGLRILHYDPKNELRVKWHEQTLFLTFSCPIGDPVFPVMDVVLNLTPRRALPLGSIWGDSPHIRRTFSSDNRSLTFIEQSVTLYREAVCVTMKEFFERMLRRVLIRYLHHNTEMSYTIQHRGDLSFFAANLNDPIKEHKISFIVGFNFVEQVFYVRYRLNDAKHGKGDLQTFDSNDPYRDVLVVMLQHLMESARKRGWSV